MIITHVSCLETVLAAADEAGIPHGRILLCGADHDADLNNNKLSPGETARDGSNSPSASSTHALSPSIKHWRSILPSPGTQALPPVPIPSPETTTALLPYSSGTTGTPKGVILTHHNLTSNILQGADAYTGVVSWDGGATNTRGDVPPAPAYDGETGAGGDAILAVLPMVHIYGVLVTVLMPLWMGVRVVVDDSGLPWGPGAYLSQIQRFGATVGYVVPPMLLGLLKVSGGKKRAELRSLRMLVSAAAPLGAGVIERVWRDAGVRVSQAFGMSETSPALAQNMFDEWWAARGGVGRPLKGVQVRILRPDGGEEEVDAGEEGEITVRGPNVFRGYLGRPEASKDSLSEDRWFKTGDVGYIDRDSGMLYITDRVKELIKSKGYQVAPAELEGHLLSCPIVEDVAVVGIWDEKGITERPTAFVVRRGGADSVQRGDEEAVIRWLEGKVNEHKKLTGGVRWVDIVPRAITGKILRRVLKEDASRENGVGMP